MGELRSEKEAFPTSGRKNSLFRLLVRKTAHFRKLSIMGKTAFSAVRGIKILSADMHKLLLTATTHSTCHAIEDE